MADFKRKHTPDPGVTSAASGASETQCVIYAAKSSVDDHGSIPSQIEACRAYAAEQGWEVIEPPESDEAISGFRASRGPGLARAKERAAAAPEGTVLLAFASDRLARGDAVEATHLVEHVIDGLKHGYRIESVTENLGGEMALVFGALYGERNTHDSKIKSEHVKRGMREHAAMGRPNGGPRRYGFEPGDGSGTLTPRPEEVAVVQRMFEMARAGKSQSAIARELNEAGHRTAQGNLWSQPKIGQALRDGIWIGQLTNMAGTFQVFDEPLIDEELWAAVQRGLSRDGTRRGRHSDRFLLANGLLRCGTCGSAMRVRAEHVDDRPYEHYSCSGRRSGATDCMQRAVRREFIDRAVLNYFEQVALDVEGTVTQIADERDRRLAEVEAKLVQARKVQTEAERQVERLDALLREGLTLDEWRRLSAVPQNELEAAALASADLTSEQEQVEATLDVVDATGEFMERLTALRATVAGEITNAEGITATQVALRRVFDGFVLHRADTPAAPRRANAELAFIEGDYILEPLVAEDARLGAMAAGTPVLIPSPLELEAVGGCKERER